MAIRLISISLLASFSDGRNVDKDTFITPLELSDCDQIVSFEVDQGKWGSAYIVFLQEDISSYMSNPEPYTAFYQKIDSVFIYLQDWLSKRKNCIHEMLAKELKISLLVDMWIDDNQMDLELPSSLLLVCGECNINFQIITND
jgi:hypothetical protein